MKCNIVLSLLDIFFKHFNFYLNEAVDNVLQCYFDNYLIKNQVLLAT